VVVLFIAASILLPTIEATLVAGTDRLPLGLSDIFLICREGRGGAPAFSLGDYRYDLVAIRLL